jgi:hypothetical protein
MAREEAVLPGPVIPKLATYIESIESHENIQKILGDTCNIRDSALNPNDIFTALQASRLGSEKQQLATVTRVVPLTSQLPEPQPGLSLPLEEPPMGCCTEEIDPKSCESQFMLQFTQLWPDDVASCVLAERAEDSQLNGKEEIFLLRNGV